jgi:hypothetical protein
MIDSAGDSVVTDDSGAAASRCIDPVSAALEFHIPLRFRHPRINQAPGRASGDAHDRLPEGARVTGRCRLRRLAGMRARRLECVGFLQQR